MVDESWWRRITVCACLCLHVGNDSRKISCLLWAHPKKIRSVFEYSSFFRSRCCVKTQEVQRHTSTCKGYIFQTECRNALGEQNLQSLRIIQETIFAVHHKQRPDMATGPGKQEPYLIWSHWWLLKRPRAITPAALIHSTLILATPFLLPVYCSKGAVASMTIFSALFCHCRLLSSHIHSTLWFLPRL